MHNAFHKEIIKKSYELRKSCEAYWHNKSSDLLYSAEVLWENLQDNKDWNCWDSYKLLMGLSFELLLKAICVQKKVDFEPNHNLNKLAELAQVELNQEERDILAILKEYIIWDAKYPIPKTPEQLGQHWEIQSKYVDKLSSDHLLPLWRKIAENYQI